MNLRYELKIWVNSHHLYLVGTNQSLILSWVRGWLLITTITNPFPSLTNSLYKIRIDTRIKSEISIQLIRLRLPISSKCECLKSKERNRFTVSVSSPVHACHYANWGVYTDEPYKVSIYLFISHIINPFPFSSNPIKFLFISVLIFSIHLLLSI